MTASLELWPSAPRRTGPPTRWDRFRRNLREMPSAVLLFVQLSGILIYPFLQEPSLGAYAWVGRAVFELFGLLVLYLAVRTVRATPALTWVAATLGTPVVLLTVAEEIWPQNDALIMWSSLAHAAFYFYTGYALLRYMFADNWVTKDELLATGATFTVLAWGFAYLYYGIQFVWPDSFVIATQPDPGFRSWYELLYLSIANMTGTGLSDIYAVTPHPRSIVLLQQMVGMLYVALVVARLVGLTIARFRQ